MPCQLRSPTPADAPALAALVRGLEVFSSDEPTGETEARMRGLIAASAVGEAVSLWLAVSERPLGYALVHWHHELFMSAPTAYLGELFVTSEARGQGAGRRLLAAVVAEATARGCRRVQLVNMKRQASYQRGFYAKLGFVERPEAADFILSLEESRC